MKAACVVAHPDDCVIFALSLIQRLDWVSWRIIYVTYQSQDSRAREIEDFWHQRGIMTRFLGYRDDWHDIELGKCSFDTDSAAQDIARAISAADFVLTHDARGDYGHVHHQWVHSAVHPHHAAVITFAPPGAGTHSFAMDPDTVDLASLPLHAETIRSFHRNQWRNAYHVPTELGAKLKLT